MTLIRQAPFFALTGYPPIPAPTWEVVDGPNAGLLFQTSVRWDNPSQTPVLTIAYAGRHIIPNTQPIPVLSFTTVSPEKVPENVLF